MNDSLEATSSSSFKLPTDSDAGEKNSTVADYEEWMTSGVEQQQEQKQQQQQQ